MLFRSLIFLYHDDSHPKLLHQLKRHQKVIEIHNLKKGFGSQEVLKNVSLQLFNGENLVVLGKSGTGKSVLIKCIVRLLHADEGSIEVLGENVDELSGKGMADLRTKIGFLFQSGALYDSMTVRQNLEFPLTKNQKKPFPERNYGKNRGSP